MNRPQSFARAACAAFFLCLSLAVGAAERVTVGFLGGSITEMDGYRPIVMKLLKEKYPSVDFVEADAGLSSTCSDTGAFRMEEDLLSKGKVDLLIVESAVNDDQDGHFDFAHSLRGVEGMVRHGLLANPACKVVVALMVNKGQFEMIGRGEEPISYAVGRAVAAHYGAALADVGTALVASDGKGGMTWAKYKDCHPSPEGCAFGARIVVDAIAKTWDPTKAGTAAPLPKPIDPYSYATGRTFPLAKVACGAGWQVSRPDWDRAPGDKRKQYVADAILWSETPGAVAEFRFRGTAAGAFLTAGPDAGALEVSVDGANFTRHELRAFYCPLHYPYVQMLADGLADREHVIRLRVAPAVRDGKAVSAVRVHRLYVNATDGSAALPWKMFDRRVGMFVHWGIYSVDGFHEQQRMKLGIPRAEYAKKMASFTAAKFDADAFVDAAESLGAEYIVITTKHHDGFCLWATETTDFNVMNTPAKRDVIRELADACRRRGMKLGFYYSNPDWNHVNGYNMLSSHQVPPEAGDLPNMDLYRKYVKAQVMELLSNYGEICCLFWDIPSKIHDPSMNALARRLQPAIMIDDRGWGRGEGDYSTPERGIPDGAAFLAPTEACDSVGARSWGFRAGEDYRTVGYVTHSIDHILSMGGNFLLNVGPKADGTIPAEALALLKKTGDWYRRVRESYFNVTTEPGLALKDGVMVTKRGDDVYLHYPLGLLSTGVSAKPFDTLPAKATLLNTGAELKTELIAMPDDGGKKTLHVTGIPADELANESVVIRLAFAAPQEDVLFRTAKFADSKSRRPSADLTEVKLVRRGGTVLVEALLENEDLAALARAERHHDAVQEAYGATRIFEFTFGGEADCLHACVALNGDLWTNCHRNFPITRRQEGTSVRLTVEVPADAIPRCVGDRGAFLAKFCRKGPRGFSSMPLLPGVSLDSAEGGVPVRLAKQADTADYYRNGMDWEHGFRACWVRDFYRIEFEPEGGATAGGFHVTNTNKTEDVYFHNGSLSSATPEEKSPMVKIPSLSMSSVFTLKVKGRGKFRFGFNPWTREGNCLYPSEKTSLPFTLDSPDEWREIRAGFTPAPDGVYARESSVTLPSLWLGPETDIRIDDLEIRYLEDIVETDESLASDPFPKGVKCAVTPHVAVTPTMRGRFVADEWKNARAVGDARFLRDGRMLYIAAETEDRDLGLALTGVDGEPFALAVLKSNGHASTPSKRPIYTFVNRAPDWKVVYRIALPLNMVRAE